MRQYTIAPGAVGIGCNYTRRNINAPGAGFWPEFYGAVDPRRDPRIGTKGLGTVDVSRVVVWGALAVGAIAAITYFWPQREVRIM